jgi:hypothetical protein
MLQPFDTTSRVRTAVVTGRHPFDVPNFHMLFHHIPEIEYYPQHMEDWACDAAGVRSRYDVVVFYHFHRETPTGEGDWWDAPTRPALETLGTTEQGIVVLHHALLAFPQWDFWTDVTGLPQREEFGFHIGEKLQVDVADAVHPITRGLDSWEITDETYTTDEPTDDCHVLLTTEHDPSMRALAWTRQYEKSPVFCLQLGHDNLAWSEPNFRTVLQNGIMWAAGRI